MTPPSAPEMVEVAGLARAQSQILGATACADAAVAVLV
jgi:hypothetical protein